MAAEMNERRELVLKLVIQEFIENPLTPVASELLVRKYGMNVSSATIRNEMAALEDLGYLTHSHTSAGRVPTDAGYRYYVENLMDRTPLSATEQRTIRHQFYQVRSELDQWIQLAGAVLARTAQNASVVTQPRAYQARFKHLELIAIHDTTVLLVLVLHDGTIRQQTFALDTARSQDELGRSASRINERCLDAAVGRILSELGDRVAQRGDTAMTNGTVHLALEAEPTAAAATLPHLEERHVAVFGVRGLHERDRLEAIDVG